MSGGQAYTCGSILSAYNVIRSYVYEVGVALVFPVFVGYNYTYCM